MNRKEDTVFCYYAHNSVWTCELGYGADTMFRRTYFLFYYDDDDVAVCHAQVQNSRCESPSSRRLNKYLKRTESNLWRTEKFELKTGLNVLYWRAFLPPSAAARMRKPVRIQSIDISGLFHHRHFATAHFFLTYRPLNYK